MKRGGFLLGLALLGACHRALPARDPGEARVDPHGYDAFYLWPGIKPPQGVDARLLYLLDGEIRRSGRVRFDRLRMGTPHLADTRLWLVVRAERLDWDEQTYRAVLDALEQWQRAGNDVVGLQVDFDTPTKGIGAYRRFLGGLRARLPARWRLSITGLMDWSAHGDPGELLALRTIVDEVVVQTYQGSATIPGYARYFSRMRGFPIPFRVALAQGGAWAAPPGLSREPAFKGYVVFLLRQAGSRKDVMPSSGM